MLNLFRVGYLKLCKVYVRYTDSVASSVFIACVTDLHPKYMSEDEQLVYQHRQKKKVYVRYTDSVASSLFITCVTDLHPKYMSEDEQLVYQHRQKKKRFKSLRYLRLSNSKLNTLMPWSSGIEDIFRGLSKIESLDFSRNGLTQQSMDRLFIDQYQSLSSLNLWRNEFHNLPITVSKFANLTYLNMRKNRLLKLDMDTTTAIDKLVNIHGKFSLHLARNELVCTCESLDFVEWLFTAKVTLDNHGNYPCILKTGEMSTTKDVYNKLRQMRLACVSKTWLIISCMSLIVLLVCIVLLALILQYRFTIELYYYLRFKPAPDPPQDHTNYYYNAYVSYHRDSLEWIRNSLLQHLENKRNLKLYVRDRNSTPGVPIADGIFEAMSNSRKIIFIITREFLHNEWCWYEMEQARLKSIRGKRKLLVLIFYEEIPVKEVERCLLFFWSTCSSFTRPNEDSVIRPNEENVFWERLYRAITK